jgi:hypothetical protein
MGFYLNDYLVANGISLRKRISDLFDELQKNPELSQVFIKNPITVLQSKLLPEFKDADEELINAANQLLYSVLTNEKFMNWLEKYHTKLVNQYNETGKMPNKKTILQAFTKGIMENGDPKILSDLLEVPPKIIASTSLGWRHVWYYVEYYAWAYIYFFYVWIFAFGPVDRVSLLDENKIIITIAPKELKLLAEQIVKHAKEIREQDKESTLEK